VANLQLRSRQLHDLVSLTLRLTSEGKPADLSTVDEKTIRHDLRGHAAYLIGTCRLWLKQAQGQGLQHFVPALKRLETTATDVVALLDRMMSVAQQTAPPAVEQASLAELLQYMDQVPASQERGRLLIVDDNAQNREYLCELLTEQGHQVVTAAGGVEALHLVAVQPFDLVLLDVLMPGMTGFALLERLKTEGPWRHIPVIMLSSLEEGKSVITGIARGAEDYLTRPVDPLLLRARIGACLEKKRLRDREIIYLRRIDELLHAIFPPEVVTELKETSAVQPRRYEHVGVLFADVVAFTAFCDTHRDHPEQVVQRLQEHFLACERIARKHDVQRIKTIGDAFMGTAGLLRPCANPVLTLLRCGQDLIESARAGPGSWDIRVGIHVGPVVAGVLGEAQCTFDLWGDTVNLASRMENCGQPGTITLSADAWKDIADLCRGESHWAAIRGKGPMEVVRFLAFMD
jgi:CheY-like chemotaxis protein